MQAIDKDVVTGACNGQAIVTATPSSNEDLHSESAAAFMQDDAPSSMHEGIAAGNETMHDAEASAPAQLAPLPMLTQLADDSVPSQLYDPHAAAQGGEVEDAQMQQNHATTKSPGAAAMSPADGHGTHDMQPAPEPTLVQSGTASPSPHSRSDEPMTEAADNHAPCPQAGAYASSELADGAATMLAEGTSLVERTAPREPADEPTIDEGAIPMQIDLPTPEDQQLPAADKHEQPQLDIAGVYETAQPQAQLQSSKAHAADAQHSTQAEAMETVESGVDHLALGAAESIAVPESARVDTVTLVDTSTTSVPGTVPVRQDFGSTGMSDPSAHRLAQHDTNMEAATSHGDQLSNHPMPGGEPVGKCLEPSNQIQPAASGTQSDVGLGVASERAERSSSQAAPFSPTGLQACTAACTFYCMYPTCQAYQQTSQAFLS